MRNLEFLGDIIADDYREEYYEDWHEPCYIVHKPVKTQKIDCKTIAELKELKESDPMSWAYVVEKLWTPERYKI
jgi:hypothetical protein